MASRPPGAAPRGTPGAVRAALHSQDATQRSTTSLFRTGPLRTLADLEQITSPWVHWYNTNRLMHRLGRPRPPAEAEADHYTAIDPADPAGHN